MNGLFDPGELVREVHAAAERIRPFVARTPIERSPWLEQGTGSPTVHLKRECDQHTGSFKLRGAASRLTALREEERAAGVVAASTGNHGLGVGHAARALGIEALVFAPETADPTKLEKVRALGVEVRLVGRDCVESETAARRLAEGSGRTYVSPYNDRLVVAGQGTVGLELAQDLPELEVVYVAVGGGGLVSGVGGLLKALVPSIEVVGCSPRNSAVLCRSLEAGRILPDDSLPTLSDGTAGGVEADALTFPLAARAIDRFELVSEDEIAAAMRALLERHDTRVEGAAGVALAALARDAERLAGRRACVVLCGGNVSPTVGARVFGPETRGSNPISGTP